MTLKIFIFGATSAIAEATARLLTGDRSRFFLVARDARKLGILAQDLCVRGAERVQTAVCDARDFERHDALINEACSTLGGLDLAIIAHGTLPDQGRCEASFSITRRELEN